MLFFKFFIIYLTYKYLKTLENRTKIKKDYSLKYINNFEFLKVLKVIYGIILFIILVSLLLNILTINKLEFLALKPCH